MFIQRVSGKEVRICSGCLMFKSGHHPPVVEHVIYLPHVGCMTGRWGRLVVTYTIQEEFWNDHVSL